MLPGKQLHLRLTAEQSEKLDELCAELPALNRQMILRGLLSDQLRKPLDERVSIVTEQLKRKPGKPEGKHSRSGSNAKNRIAGD